MNHRNNPSCTTYRSQNWSIKVNITSTPRRSWLSLKAVSIAAQPKTYVRNTREGNPCRVCFRCRCKESGEWRKDMMEIGVRNGYNQEKCERQDTRHGQDRVSHNCSRSRDERGQRFRPVQSWASPVRLLDHSSSDSDLCFCLRLWCEASAFTPAGYYSLVSSPPAHSGAESRKCGWNMISIHTQTHNIQNSDRLKCSSGERWPNFRSFTRFTNRLTWMQCWSAVT